ncbi:MAG TPA: GNAT family N-acetyltransferase [Thermoanaerobaculia bacterium]|jgi:aminoglycoside 6'-N-acetyltransferase I|nr:GNAT family N-acetyltransferase [Thermoanaerobaculia bacterium]
MTAPAVRMPEADDEPEWLRLRRELWPDCGADQQELEMGTVLADADRAAVFVSPAARGLAGFLEVALRPWQEGCPGSPVAYVEALYVAPAERGRGVARVLLEAAEAWARDRGCRAIAADTPDGNQAGRATHRQLGYAEAGMRVRMIKTLLPERIEAEGPPA